MKTLHDEIVERALKAPQADNNVDSVCSYCDTRPVQDNFCAFCGASLVPTERLKKNQLNTTMSKWKTILSKVNADIERDREETTKKLREHLAKNKKQK